MNHTRILFMGTPDFAVAILESLIQNNYNVIGVVSQPDRPIGRDQVLTPTPTKKVALAHNIPVFQVEKIRKDYTFIKELQPDLIITCAYGQIVPQGLLDIPKLGCINVHASLLPKLRGGAPIHHALIDGYQKTGVSIMKMIDKMDAGEVYQTIETPILDTDNLATLYNRLKTLGSQLLIQMLPSFLEGKIQGVPQDESQVTYGYNIKREEEKIDWNDTSRQIFNRIRGLSPIPGAYTNFHDTVIKIYDSKPLAYQGNEIVGTIINDKDQLLIKTKDGALSILELQVAGKKKMPIKIYLNGLSKSIIGERFV